MEHPVAVISGASGGIGQAIALALAKEGYRLVLGCYRHKEKAEHLSQIIDKIGSESVIVQSDIGTEDGAIALIQTAYNQFGSVDVLINNAGVASIKILSDVSSEEWHHIFAVNMDSAFYTSKAVIPFFLKNHRGTILNISSMWGLVGASCEVPYSASKAALIGFSKALAKELAPSGITVNVIAPGAIDTEMNHCVDPQALKEFVEDIPLGRLGTPEEIGDLAAFLISEKARYITGQVISPNGGLVI